MPAMLRQRASNLPLGRPLPGTDGHPLPQWHGKPPAGGPASAIVAPTRAAHPPAPGSVQGLRPQSPIPHDLPSPSTSTIQKPPPRSTAYSAFGSANVGRPQLSPPPVAHRTALPPPPAYRPPPPAYRPPVAHRTALPTPPAYRPPPPAYRPPVAHPTALPSPPVYRPPPPAYRPSPTQTFRPAPPVPTRVAPPPRRPFIGHRQPPFVRRRHHRRLPMLQRRAHPS
jgi:hypothetical protein